MNMLRRLGGRSRSPQTEPRPPATSGLPSRSGARIRCSRAWSKIIACAREAALQLVDSARLPEATRRKARFAMQLMCDAFAPSNVPWLNPGVVKEAMDTQAA